MKTLKVKNLLFSLLTLFAIAMFATSCQQDVLTDDLTNMVEQSTSETELRGCTPQAPNVNSVVYYLNLLIGQIQTRNAGRSANISGFYNSYADYLEDVLCLDHFGININWDNTDCTNNGGGEPCNLFLVGAIDRLRCDLQAFDANPSCANAISLQIRFVDYIRALNDCQNLGLNEDGYALALQLPGCSGYLYPQN